MLRLSLRRKRLATRLGSVLVLLLAVLPQVLYLGNPAAGHDSSSETASSHHAHHDETAAQHANHCHIGPKSCAGSEGAVIALGSRTAAAVPNDSISYRLESEPANGGYMLWQRPDEPPRAV
jgi:hypothetical protein